jgi:hypothetical protein
MHMRFFAPVVLLLAAACNDTTEPDGENEEEVVTTVELTFSAGGTDIVATWADPEDDGSPVIDDITLADGTSYDVTIRFLNELEDPAEEITTEIEDEDDEHQVFFTGDAVGSILTHAYEDADAGGLPVGLDNTIDTTGTGTGELTITLRHLPEEDGTAQKVEGLADDAAANGFGDLPGDNDFQGTFNVTVE